MLNNFQCIGHVGKQPETKIVGSSQVTTFSVALSERWKNKAGEKQEKTTWVKSVCWAKLSELVNAYVDKGSLVYVSGKLDIRKYQTTDGTDRWATEIIANEVKFLSPKGQQQSSGQSDSQSQSYSDAHGMVGGKVQDDVPF